MINVIDKVNGILNKKQFNLLEALSYKFLCFRSIALARIHIEHMESNTASFYIEEIQRELEHQKDAFKLIISRRLEIPKNIYQRLDIQLSLDNTNKLLDSAKAYAFKIKSVELKQNEINNSRNAKQCDPFHSLYDALICLSDKRQISFYSQTDLEKLINTFHDDLLLTLIGEEALNRAANNPKYCLLIEKIIAISKEQTKVNENDFAKLPFSSECHPYLAMKYNEFKKLNLKIIKNNIEEKLKNAVEKGISQPWHLGWAGSHFTIEYENKTLFVPEGIYEIYKTLTEKSSHDIDLPSIYEQIKNTISNKNNEGNAIKFFKACIGKGRALDAQATYDHFDHIVNHRP